MKRLTWLILLIGMISFTGLSTTTDLPENSDIAYAIDYDVGDVTATAIVVDNFEIHATLEKEIFLFRQPELMVENHFQYEYSLIELLTKRKEEPPSTNNFNLSKANKSTYRSPRDSL